MGDFHKKMDDSLPIIKEFIDILWFENQVNCILCGNLSTDSVCPSCKETYFLENFPRCKFCGKIIPMQKQICKDCESGNGPEGLSQVTALGYYNGSLKEYIHHIKFKGQPYLLFPLTEYLISWVIDILPPPDALVAVPMHSARLALRGYNQAEVLASILSRRLGIRCYEILQRNKETASQSALGRRERLQNLQGAFTLRAEPRNNIDTVWLVDDVVTTGSTLEECARVLKTSGIRTIYAVCLCAGREE